MPAANRLTPAHLGHLARCAGGAFAGETEPAAIMSVRSRPATQKRRITLFLLVIAAAALVYFVI